ncbi:MAG: O-antigen ligase family protein, partial [Bacteroidota bacterium]
FKYLFAKVWYILPFYVLPFYLVRTDRQLHQLLDWFIVGVMIGGVYFFARHLMNGFDFAGRVNIGQPLWRNHVNYACTLVCSLPIVWYREHTTTSSPWVYRLLAICLLVFIHLAYARVAYLCIGAALLVYWVIRLRLVIPSLIGIIASLLTLWSVAIKDLQYVAFAPEYERAITQNDFGSKLVATFNKQDISSMERVHRWVAGMRMSADRPIVGFGPANFYSSYRPYTIHSFETYVSDNPERSGIHCYYLMILVEQGWPGLLLFVIIGVIALLRCQSLYHHASDPSYRQLVLMVAMILVMILTLNLINDMIEVIKIGSLYFFCFFLLYYQAATSTQEEELLCS